MSDIVQLTDRYQTRRAAVIVTTVRWLAGDVIVVLTEIYQAAYVSIVGLLR